jgi:hypothetical protein
MASVLESVPETVIGNRGEPEWAEPQLTPAPPAATAVTPSPPIDVLFLVRASIALALAVAGLLLWRRRRTHAD